MKYQESKRQKWVGKDLGIGFEINKWRTEKNSFEDEKDNWVYYIFLHISRIPEAYNPESFWLKGKKTSIGNHISYDYYSHPILSNIHFHGGITWYSKEHGFDGAEKIIKVGCDYQHYWDEGQVYELRHVLADVARTIEEFRAAVPDYKYWCGGNGKLYNLSEGVLKNEEFYSNEYYQSKKPA